MAREVVVGPRAAVAKRRAGRNGYGPMTASKYPSPEARQNLSAVSARPRGARAGASLVPIQEKVIAEIGHELGNFFHKLYYWSDFLQDKPARQSADATAVQMLERTIRNLEEFLKVSLEYFHPTQLACMRMGAVELVDACSPSCARSSTAPPSASPTPATGETGASW